MALAERLNIERIFRKGAPDVQARRHQVDGVNACLLAAAAANGADGMDGARAACLCQHSTGSGKSLSIVALATALVYEGRGEDTVPQPSASFALVLVLNDRIQLDEQITSQGCTFLMRNGVPEERICKAQSVAHLRNTMRSLCSSSPGGAPTQATVVFSTLQKVAALVADPAIELSSSSVPTAGSFARILEHGRVAVIADEAHRSHGSVTSDRINMLFNATKSACSQPEGVFYAAFTATPSPTALQLFGRASSHDGAYAPHHVYSMSDAIEDGHVMDVLEHYTCVSTNIQLGVGETAGCQGLRQAETDRARRVRILRDSNLTKSQMLEAANYSPEVLRYKAKVISKYYCRALKEKKFEHATSDGKGSGDPFFPRAMVVCRSRLHVVAYRQLLTSEIKRLKLDLNTYGAFSGEVDTSPLVGLVSGDTEEDKFDDVNVRPQKRHRKHACDSVVSESSLNNVSLAEAHIIVVCSKLETGFDDPRLTIMFIDRMLQGARAVQVLSRLNRRHPRKRSTRVIDFVNQAETVREAFETFWGETTFCPGREWAKARASMRCDSIVSRLLEALPTQALLRQAPVLSTAVASGSSIAAIVDVLEHDTLASSGASIYDKASMLRDLDGYLELCENYGFQKYAMPVAFCTALRRSLLRSTSSSSSSSPSSSLLSLSSSSSSSSLEEDYHFEEHRFGVDKRALDVVRRAGVSCSSLTKSFEGRINVARKYSRAAQSSGDLPYSPVEAAVSSSSEGKMTLSSSIEKCGQAHPSCILHIVRDCQEVIKSALAGELVDVLVLRDTLRKLRVLDIDVTLLASTSIGKTVKPLRKIEVTGDAVVVDLSTQLITEWRVLASDEMPLEVREETGSGFHRDDANARATRLSHLKLLQTALSRPAPLQSEAQSGSAVTEAKEKHILQIAREIEREIFEMVGRSADSALYRTKIRYLTSNLGNRKDGSLRQRVAGGNVSIRQLCRMSTEDLASAATRAERSKIVREREAKERGAHNNNAYAGIGFQKCPSCGAATPAAAKPVDAEWISAGRSALVTCSACGHRWDSDD